PFRYGTQQRGCGWSPATFRPPTSASAPPRRCGADRFRVPRGARIWAPRYWDEACGLCERRGADSLAVADEAGAALAGGGAPGRVGTWHASPGARDRPVALGAGAALGIGGAGDRVD